MRLCICDLDGVIVDNTARFERAKQAYIQAIQEKSGWIFHEDKTSKMDVYWQTAFDPALLSLDTLIPGVSAALVEIERSYQHLLFLTSRPDSMRAATLDWLWQQHAIIVGDELLCKPDAFQFTKTVTWKVGTIQMLASLYNADALLVIDDQEENRTAMQQAPGPWSHLDVAASVHEAVQIIRQKVEARP